MFFTVYQTTNTVNNKIYIGTHITNDPNDAYLGSGKLIDRAIKKHGIESFQKTILFCYDNAEEMFAKEAELVNEEFIQRSDTYNIKCGGEGGWDYVNKNGLNNSPDINIKNSINRKRSLTLKDKPASANTYLAVSQAHKDGKCANNYLHIIGIKHTKETKEKIGKANSFHQQGSKNSMFGRCWITNGIENKSIPKENFDKYISMGYNKGRIMVNRGS